MELSCPQLLSIVGVRSVIEGLVDEPVIFGKIKGPGVDWRDLDMFLKSKWCLT